MNSISTNSTRNPETWRTLSLICSIIGICLGVYVLENILAIPLIIKECGRFNVILSSILAIGGFIGLYSFIKKDDRAILAAVICYLTSLGLLFVVDTHNTITYMCIFIMLILISLTYASWSILYRNKKKEQ